MKTMFFTNRNWHGTIVRLAMAVVLFPHGAQKMLGLFGGFGFTNTMTYFTHDMGLPWLVSLLVILLEFLGSLALLLGIAGRFFGLSVIGLMLGIAFSSHLDYGFFMNWFGNQKGEGLEYFILFIGLAAALAVNGSGKLSIDSLLSQEPEPNHKTIGLSPDELRLDLQAGTASRKSA